MKPSRFNRLVRASDGAWLLWNAWSTALAEIEPGDLDFVRACLADPGSVRAETDHERELLDGLARGGFLVEDEIDELARIKVAMFRDRFRTDRLMLTIAPTLDCNFRCDYCYEEHLRVTMARPVQEALIGWVEAQADGLRALWVTWYGGEPLLPRSREVIRNLTEGFRRIARERNLDYGAELVTNGYLLDRAAMEEMLDLGVERVQVTLDGPREIHDRRRVLTGGGGTFDRIVANLEQVVDLAEIQLRINVDRRNALACLEVVELLVERGLARMVRPYIAQVTFDGAACGNIQEACYSSAEFARTEVEIYREAARRGLPLGRYPVRIPGAFCTADRSGAFVVGPSGLLFKCWHEVTLDPSRAVGSVVDGQEPWQKATEDRWLAWDPFEKPGCRECDILPICHGGCPLEALEHPERDRGSCERYRYNLDGILEVRRLARERLPAAGHSRGGAPGDAE